MRDLFAGIPKESPREVAHAQEKQLRCPSLLRTQRGTNSQYGISCDSFSLKFQKLISNQPSSSLSQTQLYAGTDWYQHMKANKLGNSVSCLLKHCQLETGQGRRFYTKEFGEHTNIPLLLPQQVVKPLLEYSWLD